MIYNLGYFNCLSLKSIRALLKSAPTRAIAMLFSWLVEDLHRVWTRCANEGQIKLLCELDCHVCGDSFGYQHGDMGTDPLLDHVNGDATTAKDDAFSQINTIAQGTPNHLVKGVVSAQILATIENFISHCQIATMNSGRLTVQRRVG